MSVLNTLSPGRRPSSANPTKPATRASTLRSFGEPKRALATCRQPLSAAPKAPILLHDRLLVTESLSERARTLSLRSRFACVVPGRTSRSRLWPVCSRSAATSKSAPTRCAPTSGGECCELRRSVETSGSPSDKARAGTLKGRTSPRQPGANPRLRLLGQAGPCSSGDRLSA